MSQKLLGPMYALLKAFTTYVSFLESFYNFWMFS